jgi:membrane fusion protein, copper/silver efflux system
VEGLAADDIGSAREGLMALHDVLLEIGQHRLSGNAHAAWMRHYETLHQVTHRMAEPPGLENFRRHLQDLTLAMEAIHVNFGTGRLPALRRALCPMVEGGAEIDGMTVGTWLQSGETIRNPYFGESMLRCGEIFGTLEGHSND